MYKSIRRFAISCLLMLLLGGVGGILIERAAFPYLATMSLFDKVSFIKDSTSGTTIINKTEEVIVKGEVALEEVIRKMEPVVVGVRAYQGKNLVNQGTGFILTADGLILTSTDIVKNSTGLRIIRNEKILEGELLKQDSKRNLALVKISETSLPVVTLGNLEELVLGERVILLGFNVSSKSLGKFVNTGIIRGFEETFFEVNINSEDISASGSPLFNLKGEIIGLNLVEKDKSLKVVPIDIIKGFMEEVL